MLANRPAAGEGCADTSRADQDAALTTVSTCIQMILARCRCTASLRTIALRDATDSRQDHMDATCSPW